MLELPKDPKVQETDQYDRNDSHDELIEHCEGDPEVGKALP